LHRSHWSNGIDAHSIYDWIDNYCAAHPLESIAKSIIELVGVTHLSLHL
jgi:hypothetical protein